MTLPKLEKCPHCDGTGRRLVPPAPEPEAGCPPGRWGQGNRHGYVATYQLGCRCDLCRAAWREYSRKDAQEARKARRMAKEVAS